ncbi:gamma-glutamyl-gamma-aminobutyrate hydrolase family protein [Vibrio parahaemolyticus]|uniref:gamma-glutamyl-gamma-aminobutyrate hydrolase family protein n=1 Tax=Vibrio parahaemolyticus TaxID=670 RepID=UPI00128EB9BA|nr:gamma-glutamyl-gamma-aminobutyrate hydrolase family protein [Vibrio parahaemolyticus]MQC92650.1 peptidase C26 [Vibrio parahaemolyticus]
MKRIGLTQRVDVISNYGERRDAIDQKWCSLLLEMNMLPIPLPNISPSIAFNLFEQLSLDGVILTGGNSLSHLDVLASDLAPERDAFELALIEYALNNKIPIFGVCRGMQIINYYFKGGFEPIDGHIATNHALVNLDTRFNLPENVNSFHKWGISKELLGENLIPIAKNIDDSIKAIIHKVEKIAGIMWHPERVKYFKPSDIKLRERILF